MKKFAIILSIVSLVTCPTMAHAGLVEDLSALLKGRNGVASEDRRHMVMAPFGIHMGCMGDALEAYVHITDVSGTYFGNKTSITVTYSGTYFQTRWDVTCQRVSPNLGGLENLSLSGTFTFYITGDSQMFSINWGNGKGSNFGKINDPQHDSNIMAIRAVKEAIVKAFKVRGLRFRIVD